MSPSKLEDYEWHSRGYLPHFDRPGVIQFVSLRLADSFQHAERAEWEHLLEIRDLQQRLREVETYLDTGRGSCWLRDPRVARIVEQALLHGDGEQYHLLAWVIMPNHVHFLLETVPGWSLAEIVKGRKSFSAREANALLGRRGAFWQRDYFDRFMRDKEHLGRTILYIHYNPVKAGLVAHPEDWRYSSARLFPGV